MRNTMKNWMLGTALIAGLLGTGAAAANAASWGFHGDHDRRFERGYERRDGERVYGRSYVETYRPACPGEGYVWTDGYYNGGYWVPGSWVFRGNGFGYGGGYSYDRRPVERYDYRRDENRFQSGERNWDRGANRGEDRGNNAHYDHRQDFRSHR